MADEKPIDAHVVVLDTQALREGGWPNPNARLSRLAELVDYFTPHLWIVHGALDEIRGHVEREALKAADDLAKARSAAIRRGLKADASSAGIEDILANWDQRTNATLKELGARVVEYTKRGVQQLFDMAVQRVPPFNESGAGFRDAVIYLSVVDELKKGGWETAILITRDADFARCKSPEAGQQIHVMNLDDAIRNFEDLLRTRKDEIVQQLIAEMKTRHDLATRRLPPLSPKSRPLLKSISRSVHLMLSI